MGEGRCVRSFRALELTTLETSYSTLNDAILHISGLANSGYRRFCPEIYLKYKDNDQDLRAWMPNLRKNWKRGMWVVDIVECVAIPPDKLRFGPRRLRPFPLHYGNITSTVAYCTGGLRVQVHN